MTSFVDMLKTLFKRNMLAQFFIGIYGGLPLLLTGSTLQAWMREEGVDLKTIGIFALVGLPYTLKFLWSPLMDRFVPPMLDRRRGWLVICQALLCLVIAFASFIDPKEQTWMMAFMAVLIAFLSSSQDIVIDAYRRETLDDEELGLGTSMYVSGYRIALLISGAFALFLAESIPWQKVYLTMAAIMGSGMIFTVLSPKVEGDHLAPKTIREAVVEPFLEYFKRDGAIIMLLFILFYKVGDSMAAHMSMPLYLDKGYSKLEIAGVVKGIGLAATILGGFAGGFIMLRLKINRSLWIFGLLQMISTLGFSLLAFAPKGIGILTAVIGFENLSSGMGTSAFVAFMASLTDKRFTATQYALLTSLMGVPRVIAAAPTGWMVEVSGYGMFFVFCTVIALPGLGLLHLFAPWRGKK